MAQRISISQLQNKIRQAESKSRQAISKMNQEIRNYNSNVRAHNARVRANRDHLRRELQKLARAARKPQYVTYRASVETVRRSYERLEQRAEACTYDNRFDRFLNLSEQEAANAVCAINAIQGDEPENGTEAKFQKSRIEHKLDAISQEFGNRWRGALIALSPENPEAARHFCTSARELLTEIFNRFANDKVVRNAIPDCELTRQGDPTRKAKIRYIFQQFGIVDDAATAFVDEDINNVVQLFHILNDGTHGSSGRFGHSQLAAIRARVEGAVSFLLEVVTGQAFAQA